MSAITIHLCLAFNKPEHAKLVSEAFSQWPTNTVRKKTPSPSRIKAIKTSMEYMGYQLPNMYQLVFNEQSCQLEIPPTYSERSKQYCVNLEFYCSKKKGYDLWDALFTELSALPVTLEGSLYADFDGHELTKCLTVE